MKEFGLPRERVLRAKGEFDGVYRCGQRFRGRGFAIIASPNTLTGSRLGISVQKKTGNAVRRNRIKRLIREVFRLHQDLFPASSDIIFTVRPGFAVNSLKEMTICVTHAVASRQHVQ
jgi:ribonuclease P protein component